MGILVEDGVYKNKKELLNDAYRSLLRDKPSLKKEMAVSLYKKERVSLSKAAEMAGMSLEDFKEVLGERGVRRPMAALGKNKTDEKARIILERVSKQQSYAERNYISC